MIFINYSQHFSTNKSKIKLKLLLKKKINIQNKN